ncbi:MAG: pentapeptide repeat-containing protein [Gammaproteobacteria bacterium]|nr:pentapeptide repeat-containing protein [Gammaproteobacteria bacterium]
MACASVKLGGNFNIIRQLHKKYPVPLFSVALQAAEVKTYPSEIHQDEAIIQQAYRHEHTVFPERVSFVLSTFKKPVDFYIAEFKQVVDFSNTSFEAPAYFSWSKFSEDAIFNRSKFYAGANFYYCRFLDPASFYYAFFQGPAEFIGAHFYDRVDFSSTRFVDNAEFQRSQFDKRANFQRAIFQKGASFSRDIFFADISFAKAIFKDHFNLQAAVFMGKTNFFETVLPHYLNLSNITKINSIIDLTKTIPLPNHERTLIDLTGSDVTKFRFTYNHFKLVFPQGVSYSDRVVIYEELLKSFKDNGFKKSYSLLYAEYKSFVYNYHRQYIINFVQKYWWNYGLDKSRIFIWMFVLLFIFSIINTLFYKALVEGAYHVSFLDIGKNYRASQKNPVVRFILNFPITLVYTIMLFFGGLMGFQRNANEFTSKSWLVNLYLMIMIAFGLLCVLFILNFIIKI